MRQIISRIATWTSQNSVKTDMKHSKNRYFIIKRPCSNLSSTSKRTITKYAKLCPDFGSIYKQLSSNEDFTLDARLLKDMKSQMHKQSAMRIDKQKIPKGKLIV
jgi:hypothetical protein